MIYLLHFLYILSINITLIKLIALLIFGKIIEIEKLLKLKKFYNYK